MKKKESITGLVVLGAKYKDKLLNRLINDSFASKTKEEQEALIGLANIRLHFLKGTKAA